LDSRIRRGRGPHGPWCQSRGVVRARGGLC
jgi:hypothetical protein